ncbi:MAG: choice-of-anchor D domain-containing protein [Bacteroidales bacterium]|nr:choice-of-anchor D domain-containing protein [Bacteroidales bacterium]
MKTKIQYTFLLITFALFLFSQSAFNQNEDWTIVESWPLTVPGQASGLAWDGTYFYYGIYGSDGDKVYRFDPSDGSSVLLFSSPDLGDTFGMTYDGSHLWITDHVTSSSVPAYAMQFDFSGNLLTQFDLPDHYMSGIAYDNDDFWVATYYPDPGTIYKVDNTGAILAQFQSPGEQPWDLCLENDNLWVVDYYADMIYRTDLSGNILESHPSENIQPSGIEYDGQYLWYIDGGSGTSKIYKIDLGGVGTPEIEVPIDYYNYGNVSVGDSAVWYCTINNIGTADLDITNLVIQNAVPIFVWMTFPQTISPGNSLDIPFIFKPTEIGSLNTIVTIESTDPVTSEVEVTLEGEAVFDGPHINVPYTSYNYGNIRMNATSRWNLEIQNDGSQQLLISDILIDDFHFYLDDNVSFPLSVNVLESVFIGIWFNPDQAISFLGVAEVMHNDVTQDPIEIDLVGSGIEQYYPIGDNLWNYTINTGWDNSVKAITPINDVSGDGITDVIVGSEDNFIRCFNGNASGSADILWENEAGDVWNQNDIAIIEDINGDGYDDVIAGKTGIGAVKAISGKTGEIIWTFDTQQFGDGGWIYQVWTGFDYNEDDSNDVLAASGGSATGSRRIFCIDGISGDAIWVKFTDGPNFSVIGVEDFTGDGKPDVIGGASNSNESEGKVHGINGDNGTIEWTFTTEGSAIWALEQLADINGDQIKDIIAGDSYGNYFFLDPTNGSSIFSGSVGLYKIVLRFEKLDDVNGDDVMDIAVAKSGPLAVIIDGYTGEFIWSTTLFDQSWNIDRIEDVSGDGINDVIIGTLYGTNYCYFLDGTTGETIHSFNFGEAVDGIGAIPDITGDGSWEMVAGGREGKLVCYSGGLNSAVLTTDFMADTTYGTIPFEVQFSDLTSGSPTFWEWDFDNDGMIDSYDQNPSYEYTQIGIYSVKLAAGNSSVSDTIVKIDYITADSTVNIKNHYYSDITVSPNPFSHQTTLSYYLIDEGMVSCQIFNLHGKQVKNLIPLQFQKSGKNEIIWDGTNDAGQKVKSGIYLISFQIGTKIYQDKILIK